MHSVVLPVGVVSAYQTTYKHGQAANFSCVWVFATEKESEGLVVRVGGGEWGGGAFLLMYASPTSGPAAFPRPAYNVRHSKHEAYLSKAVACGPVQMLVAIPAAEQL